MAHSVTQHTKEIGVRIARGAASQDIRRLIFREGMLPVALGLIVGLTVSLAVNRILQSQLVGVSPYDPVTLATAPAVLILVGRGYTLTLPARTSPTANTPGRLVSPPEWQNMISGRAAGLPRKCIWFESLLEPLITHRFRRKINWRELPTATIPHDYRTDR